MHLWTPSSHQQSHPDWRTLEESRGSRAWWRLVCLPASQVGRLPPGSLSWALHSLCQLPTAFDKAQCFVSALGLWTSLANRKWIKLNWENFFHSPLVRFFIVISLLSPKALSLLFFNQNKVLIRCVVMSCSAKENKSNWWVSPFRLRGKHRDSVSLNTSLHLFLHQTLPLIQKNLGSDNLELPFWM